MTGKGFGASHNSDSQCRGCETLCNFIQLVGVDTEAGEGLRGGELGVGFWAEVCWMAAAGANILLGEI